mmetsp:Transcript_15320/g.42445  ORF Transcript_15320/g.42445 Transcript_15320/m.42445 type:complete len:233 (+) Transcript_15320:598-1296(+)
MPILSILRYFAAVASSSSERAGALGTGAAAGLGATAAGAAACAGTVPPSTAAMILVPTPSWTILCFTASSGRPILSILRNREAVSSSSAESEGVAAGVGAAAGARAGSEGEHTALIIFGSTPSATILCSTASSGSPILSILRNLPAMASSSADNATAGAGAAAGVGAGAAGAGASPPQTEAMIFESTPSEVILCLTTSSGSPIFCILRKRPAMASSSADRVTKAAAGAGAGA